MQDMLGREITYLRVSVTERCNLRCLYCRPEAEGPGDDGSLSNAEFLRVIETAAGLGVKKIRLTGGEPLLRRDLEGLIRGIRSTPGIDEITLTTNGLLLSAVAAGLKASGLNRVNISLDSLKPDRFRKMTRGGDLSQVMRGIEASLEAGLRPVKLNVVLVRGDNDDEIPDLARLTVERPIAVRFLELMPFGMGMQLGARSLVPAAEILERLPGLEPLAADHPETAGPARLFRYPGAQGTIGIISPVSSCFCPSCNRLRLTSTGILQPCLFSSGGVDIGEALRRNAGDEELADRLLQAVRAKPGDWHSVARTAPDECGRCALGRPERYMSQIGG